MKKRILYIGNNLSDETVNLTTVARLGGFLDKEGYSVIKSSSKKNKAIRLLDMWYCTFKAKKVVSYVLIDVYSTSNFWYAVSTALICRLLKLPYIPILHGGKLPARVNKSPYWSAQLFENALVNVAPSNFLLDSFRKAGFTQLTYIPNTCLLYTSPSPRDQRGSRMPSSA